MPRREVAYFLISKKLQLEGNIFFGSSTVAKFLIREILH